MFQNPNGIALDSAGNVYIAGAPSINTNGSLGGILDPINVGTGTSYTDQTKLGDNTTYVGYSTFIAKISPANKPQISLSYPPQLYAGLPAGQGLYGTLLILRNAGSADLHISSIQTGGGLKKANSTCGSTVAAGSICFLTPSDANGGKAYGSITINSDAEPASQTYALPDPGILTGKLIGSGPVADTNKLAFPPQQFNTVSAPRSFRIWNSGTEATSVQSVSTNSGLQQTNDCGALAPQAFCTIQVTWAPVNATSGGSDVNVVYGDSSTQQVYVGYPQAAQAGPVLLSASAAGLGYGNVPVGQTSVIRTLTVTNVSNGPISVSDPTITGAQATSFGVTANTCSGVSLQPQQSCVVGVVFSPATAVHALASMTVSGGGLPMLYRFLAGASCCPQYLLCPVPPRLETL